MAELDRHYRRPLQAFFQRRGCPPATAEDLTQDVFLRIVAYQRRAEIRSVKSFLYQTATNLLRDMFRSRTRRRVGAPDRVTDPEAGDLNLIDLVTPERILEGRQDIQVVIQALEELDARTQRIFVMNRIDRLRQRDIADHLGLSVSLVEKSLRTAHVHLEARYSSQRMRRRAPGAAFAGMFSDIAEAQLAAWASVGAPERAGGTAR